MTDEIKVEAGGTPAEEALKEVVTQAEPSPSEQRAMDDGWVPKDQWKGDPDDWRPAKEFNDRGELFGRIKEQRKELDQLRGAVTFLTQQNKEQYLKGQRETVQQLQHARNAALHDGDHVTAAQLQDKLDEQKDVLKDATRQPVQAARQGPSDDFVSWRDRNAWYMKDEDATMYADAKGLKFRNANPGSSERQMLDFVTKEVSKHFPDLVPNRAPPSPNSSGSTTPRSSRSGGSSEAEGNMTDEQRSIMKTIIKSTGMTKEEYLKSYEG